VSDTVPSRARFPVIDYGHAVISPGVIDVHVHMNEPGREDWEGRCHAQQASSHYPSTAMLGGWQLKFWGGCQLVSNVSDV
jgi:imidazolonepropionase-like amidohydrolase